jgi:predicted membrane channel-forming protein YqfA (hemolysin III family)
LTGI